MLASVQSSPNLACVLQRFAAGQRAEPVLVAGDVGLDGLEIGPRQVAQRPSDSLSYEEVRVRQVGLDAVDQKPTSVCPLRPTWQMMADLRFHMLASSLHSRINRDISAGYLSSISRRRRVATSSTKFPPRSGDDHLLEHREGLQLAEGKVPLVPGQLQGHVNALHGYAALRHRSRTASRQGLFSAIG